MSLSAIDKYIHTAPEESRERLALMRELLRGLISELAPDAVEEMKYGVPAFSYRKMIVGYSGYKHHIGFYPTPAVIEAYKKELAEYPTAKGSIQFPHDKPLPLALIKKITALRVKMSREEK